MDIGLIIKGKDTTERLEEGGKWNGMCTHRVRVTEKGEINPELVEWLKEAYESAGYAHTTIHLLYSSMEVV